jgi:proliferating cell nuclear antigen
MSFSLRFKTVQSSIIKALVEALKGILVETNIECTPEGIRIVAMDEGHTTLVRLSLHAENFDDWICPAPITIGVDITQLFSLLKTMTQSEILTFFIRESNDNELGIVIENPEKAEVSCYHLKLLELNPEAYTIPQQEYDFITNMPSSDFQKICRNMKNLGAERMDIKHHKEQLIFRCEGEYATQETIRTSGSNGNNLKFVQTKEGEMYAGTFQLEKVIEFTKCTSLGPTVTILMQNDLPLIFIYPVGNLGEITLCLAPLEEQA